MAEQLRQVHGFCPMGCGKTLFLGYGGHVTCSDLACPDPAKVDELLSRSIKTDRANNTGGTWVPDSSKGGTEG